MAFGLVAIAIALASPGIYIRATNDAPSAALLRMVLMTGTVAFGVGTAQRKT